MRRTTLGIAISLLLAPVASVVAAEHPCYRTLGVKEIGKENEINEACVAWRGKQAFDDYQFAFTSRRIHNAVLSWPVHVAIKSVGLNKSEFIRKSVEQLVASSYLTDDVQAGLVSRYQAYKYQLAKASHQKRLTYQEVIELKKSWAALDEYLAKAEAGSTVPAEKALAARLRKEGALATDNLGLMALLKAGAADTAELKALLKEQFGISASTVENAIDQKLQAMVEQAAAAGEPEAAATAQAGLSGQQKVDLIAEIASVSQSTLQLASIAGLIPPDQAAKASQVVDGVSKLTMATIMFNDTAGTIAVAGATGPYGLAFAGMVSLASALATQPKSEGARIMSMLAAISRQIEDLHYTMEKRFAELSDQITQSEMRILKSISEVLASNHAIEEKVDQFTQRLTQLRSEVHAARRVDQVTRLNEVWRKAAFRDAQCLRDFGWNQKSARDECLDEYDGLVREFLVSDNAIVTGAGLTTAMREIPIDDRLHQVRSGLASVGVRYDGDTPVHGLLLPHIAERVRLFLKKNPELTSTQTGASLLAKIKAAENEDRKFRAFMADDRTFEQLVGLYEREYETVVKEFERRLATHQLLRDVNTHDAVYLREERDQHLPTAYAALPDRYPPNASALYHRVRVPVAGSAWLDVEAASGAASAEGGATPSRDDPAKRLLPGKLKAIAAVARTKDSVADVYFANAQAGHLWVTPCNPESGYPAFPVARSALANVLPGPLVRTSLVAKELVEICYQPSTNTSNAYVNNFNTNAYMDVVRARWAAVGPQWVRPFVFGIPYWCLRGQDHFAQTYGNREYRSDFGEGCHGRHHHHKLRANAPQVLGFSFGVTLKFPGYVAPIKTFSASVPSVNTPLDKCFLPYDRDGQPNKLAVLMPFLQEYPLAITKACPGADNALLDGLAKMRPAIDQFLKMETKPEGELVAKLSYAAAADRLLADRRVRYRQQLVREVFSADPARLDLLADLIAVARYYRDGRGDTTEFYPTSAEIQDVALMLLFDEDALAVRSPGDLRRTGSEVPQGSEIGSN